MKATNLTQQNEMTDLDWWNQTMLEMSTNAEVFKTQKYYKNGS